MSNGPVPDGLCRCCWITDNMGEAALAGTPLCAECWDTCTPDMPPGVFEAAAGTEPG